jgi:hypothetical protein
MEEFDSWQCFGYDTDEPCEVCEKVGGNKAEPRYYYVVCEKHHNLPPVIISEMIHDRIDKELRTSSKLATI